ncbi:MAG TPA: NAD-dependent epimerase/dehydratase family protein [Bacteroidota bacterium]|nr:NAD-dependent epimerase/dehydratase family protein [Bacteroidota bacterium]
MPERKNNLCLVLGGCGFLGSVVTRHLVAKGYHVRVLDKEGQNTDRLKAVFPKIDLQFGDFSNLGDLKRALDGVTTVLHFIGTTIPQTSMNDIQYDVETNVLPTVRLLETLKEKKARLIFSSSGGTIYGASERGVPLSETSHTEPISAYGISKLTIEKFIKLFSINYDVPSVILRFSNPFGPSQHPTRPQGAVGVFIQKALKGEEIVIWGDGSTVRDYLFEEDLGTAVTAVVDNSALSGIFNVGTGVGTSLKRLIELVEESFAVRCKVRYDPERRFDVPYNVLNISKIISETGWRPQSSLLDGLRVMKTLSENRP